MSGTIAELLESIPGGGASCLSAEIRHLLLTRPIEKNGDAVKKLTVRPVVIRGAAQWQFEWQRGSQAVHENLDGPAALDRITQSARRLQQIHIRTGSTETQGQRGADQRWKWSTRSLAADQSQVRANGDSPAPTHDRSPRHILREGTPVPFLVETGVMASDGRIRREMQHKFRQINRFLEFVRDILPALPESGPLEVVDFGCGKSSLTFALHHYLSAVLGRQVRIVGIDRKDSVVNECSRLSTTIGCAGLSFHAGDIVAYQHATPVDLAISLHACDTATDDALISEVGWQSRAILAVPCCQHEMAPKVTIPAAQSMLRHGILRERFGTLATDAFRAEWLESRGYQAQVIEFIETEHTPKNLLIRAVRRERADGRDAQRSRRLADFKSFLGLGDTYIEQSAASRLGAVNGSSDDRIGS